MNYRRAGALVLALWCAVMIAVRRPPHITDDWMGWRQADTQAIARNLAFEEFAPWRPRIDWRGDGPGYVETEAQVYPTLIAVAMRLGGESVAPGQWLSLAVIASAVLAIARALARRYGEPAGFAGLCAMLGHHGTIAMATSIQPDSLAFLLFAIGWLAFVEQRTAVWIAATALAGLVKPTTLELGVAQFVLAAIATAPSRWRARLDVPPALGRGLAAKWRWIGWAMVLAIVGADLAYAHSLYRDYGNTFGVLSGGDSKLPALSMLGDREVWTGLFRYSILWGTGVLAVPAAMYLIIARKLEAVHIALGAGALVLLLVALRYTSGRYGTHYHLPHVVLGAWLVAAAAARLRARVVVPAVAICATLVGVRALEFLRGLPSEPETVLGEQLAQLAAPDTLVVVRARAPGYATEWHTANNFEDPRVFYLSRTKGWALANDTAGAAALARDVQRGARFYVHVHQKPIDEALADWLARHGRLVADSPAGAIYAVWPDRLR